MRLVGARHKSHPHRESYLLHSKRQIHSLAMEEAMSVSKKEAFLVHNRRNVYVATDIHRKLKELAAKRDSKLQELVQDALVQYLDRQEHHR